MLTARPMTVVSRRRIEPDFAWLGSTGRTAAPGTAGQLCERDAVGADQEDVAVAAFSSTFEQCAYAPQQLSRRRIPAAHERHLLVAEQDCSQRLCAMLPVAIDDEIFTSVES